MGISYFNCFQCDDILNDCSGGYQYCEQCWRNVCDDCNKEYKIMARKDYYEDYGYLCCAYCTRRRRIRTVTWEFDDKQYKSVDELRAEIEWKPSAP